jgi:predicted dehydrogenase
MNKNKVLKLGFVGGAPSSAVGYAHFVAMKMDNLFHLEAGVFSTDKSENLAAAKQYGIDEGRLYANLTELLKHETGNLDAVVLLTPTPLHYEMIVECIKCDMPVISEKALCLSVQEAKELKQLSDSRNSFLAVIYNYSGYPMVREARSLINSGELGDILHFQAEMPQESFLRLDKSGNKPQPQSWRMQDLKIPTLHLDLAVHLHELIYYLINESPVEVVADQASYGWFDVIDNATCLTKYTGNVQGNFWFSKSAIGHRNGLKIRIYGSKASIEWLQVNPEELLVSYADGTRKILDRASNVQVADQVRYTRFKAGHPAGFNEALANLYADIYSLLVDYNSNKKNNSSEVFGVDLALEGLKWLEAMQTSIESKAWKSI